jgi:hypothetical protein
VEHDSKLARSTASLRPSSERGWWPLVVVAVASLAAILVAASVSPKLTVAACVVAFVALVARFVALVRREL